MSGHSKWSTIKRQKETADKQRGRLFSKLTRAILIAARQGSPDPEKNFKLRLLVEQARQADMPKKNIERALDKAAGGQEEAVLEEAVYEGYGPLGVAVMVEVVTDNKNRTAADIKKIFERGGGNLGRPGAVSFLFKPAGLIIVAKKRPVDKQLLQLIDLGIEDVFEAKDAIEVYTRPKMLDTVKQKIIQAGFEIFGAELVEKPVSLVAFKNQADATKVVKFLESLEEQDDVQKVWANLDLVQVQN